MKRSIAILLLVAAALTAAAQGHSVLASGEWWKIGVKESGVYRINTATVPQLAGRPFDSVALYGADGRMLSLFNPETSVDGLQPVASAVDDRNGNGIFDAGDGLLFYGEGCDTWRYHYGDKRFEMTRHAYSALNYYFITTTSEAAPLRIATATAPGETSAVATTHIAVACHNNDMVNIFKTGQVWLGEKFTNSVPNRSVSLGLPSAPVAGSSVRCRYALASVSGATAVFHVTSGSSTVSTTIPAAQVYTTVLEEFETSGAARMDFAIRYQYQESTANGYLDYIEVNAEVPLTFSGRQTFIRNAHIDNGLAQRYDLAGAPSGTRVWRVDGTTVEMGTASGGSASTLSFADSAAEAHTYIAFDGSFYLTPASVAKVDNQDLIDINEADMVIVAHPLFTGQAGQLASHHAVADGMSVVVVTPEQVFNEFSSGKQDPIAIRSLLRLMHGEGRTVKPHYLLLFGKGTYDHRNLLGIDLPVVVTYQTPFSFDEDGKSYCSDDLFGFLEATESGLQRENLDIAIGRLPAKTTDEADLMVDKILGYVNKRDLSTDGSRGDWRNYVVLLSDDADPSSPDDTSFAHSSEHTAKLIKEHFPIFNIDKIYADAYVQSSGAVGSYYPDVDNALKRRMDYGCLLLNYIGHGSTAYIGTERFIELDDISNYSNTDKLSYIVTSTCTFGRFDMPDDICGAEAFMLAKAGGIGIVSATRPINHNEKFNTDVCLSSLDKTNTIGEALRQSKNLTAVSQSICLIGDPAMKLSFPQSEVVVTHINDKPVAFGINDSAMVLSRVTVTGEIHNAEGDLESDFDGTIFPIVFDREITTHTLANDNPNTEVAFTQQKSILYKGIDSVRGGHFEYSFIVPRDVAYQYGKSKLSHYAHSVISDAAGQYNQLLLGGLDQTANIGDTRPVIELYISDTTFRRDGITDENPTIYARLWDSVGINAVGSGLGHDITATLDGNPNSVIVLNDFYETDLNDNRRGTIRYQLSKLSPGRHTLELKAWNIFNNSSSASTSFIVRSTDTATVASPLCFPNPAEEVTAFSLQINCPKEIEKVTLQIFDIYGQCVAQFNPEPNPDSYVIGPIEWHFTSHSGAKVPRGLYVARFLITTSDGETLTANTKCVKK
ncbi:MAG: type IX secretion system sortase PorU [Bacteroidales bacterium]|nr:type IX secretion system sortase PorU [Bacteroidales bacterium]